jgi:hypothetical protein
MSLNALYRLMRPLFDLNNYFRSSCNIYRIKYQEIIYLINEDQL